MNLHGSGKLEWGVTAVLPSWKYQA